MAALGIRPARTLALSHEERDFSISVGAPSSALFAKGGSVTGDRHRKREAGSKTPPFAKSASDGAPWQNQNHTVKRTQAEACATSGYNHVVAISLRASSFTVTSAAPGVILAIDYGKKRLGLALSDEHGSTSRPHATWTRINRRRDLARLRDLVRDERVRRIVVGLPLHLDGTPSEMSEEAKSFAARVEKALGLPVEMMDERLSSWEANETLASETSGKRARRGSSVRDAAGQKSKAPLDEIAAAIILRDYLERTHARAESRAESRAGSPAKALAKPLVKPVEGPGD